VEVLDEYHWKFGILKDVAILQSTLHKFYGEQISVWVWYTTKHSSMYKIILIIIHCLFSGAFLRPQARINSFITVGFLCTYISLQFCYLGLVEIICRLRYNIVAPCTCISPILYLSLSYVGTISQPKIPVSRACLYFLISLFYLIVTR
jgi:hypothetical protein